MERIIISRKFFSDLSTIGELFINGDLFCHTLELSCRRGDEKGKLAIPEGIYLLKKTYSPHFKKDMWEVMNVPKRFGIRIHPANNPGELDGCISPGMYSPEHKDWVSASRITYNRLCQRLDEFKGEIWIGITGGGPVDSRT